MNFFHRFQLKSLQKRAQLLQNKREQGEPVNAEDEIKLQMQLARFYEKHVGDKALPFADYLQEESYRNAALLGSGEAQYIFGKIRLEQAKFWAQWAKGSYGRSIHQTYAKQYFEEALTYLDEAQRHGSVLAKRLRGLTYIHAWGVEQDKERGFKLIVASINDENAWDRATAIFEELGLNTPEFFSALMTLRDKG